MPIPRVKESRRYGTRKPRYGRSSFLFTTRLPIDDLPTLFRGANIALLMGRLGQNRFGLDGDSPSEFARIGSELDKRRIRAWAITGARGGRNLMRCAGGEVQGNNISATLQIIGRCNYSVCPPSVHPTGDIYEGASRDGLLPSQVTSNSLDFLCLQVETAQRGHWPKVARQVLKEKYIGDYPSNSEAEFAELQNRIGPPTDEQRRESYEYSGRFLPDGTDELLADELLVTNVDN
jgi:hypothetical protein